MDSPDTASVVTAIFSLLTYCIPYILEFTGCISPRTSIKPKPDTSASNPKSWKSQLLPLNLSMAKSTSTGIRLKFLSPIWSRLTKTWAQLCLSLLALGLFAVVVVFVQATNSAVKFSAEKRPLSKFLKWDVSTTIAIVRASQGLLSALMTSLINSMFVLVQWNLMNSENGLSYHHLLALSPTTDTLGILAILCSPGSVMRMKSRLWLITRMFLIGIVWLSGLVLFFRTSFVTVYDTADTSSKTTGVGPFNASLLDPFISYLQELAPTYPYQVVPFTYHAAVYFLVVNPLLSTVAQPVECLSGRKCVSYLLSGGLSMVAPWIRPGHDEHTMVRIDKAPSVQLDFSGPTNNTFLETDCDEFGKTDFSIGIRLCVVEQPDDSGLRIGLFVCPHGTSNAACSNKLLPSKPNITTHVSFFTRGATIIAARSNFSIISIEETTAPVLFPPSSLDVPSYRKSLRWLLNFTASNIPPPTSIAQSFWSSQKQLSDPTTFGILEQNFHSIVAFPFWLFNSNNWGNIQLKEDELVPGLPPQFYTTASIVEPVVKIRFDKAMFILFAMLQGVAMVFVWTVLAWIWFRPEGQEDQTTERGLKQPPKTSSFPLWDIVFRARTSGGEAIDKVSKDALMKANDMEILELLKDTTVHYGREEVQNRDRDVRPSD